MIDRTSNVVETATNNITLKQMFRKFNTSADPAQERIHVENKHPEGRIFKESSIHNSVMNDVNRHRENRFRNRQFFKVDRVHESFITEFGKRRTADQDRKQHLINNRFPSLAEARDQYLK